MDTGRNLSKGWLSGNETGAFQERTVHRRACAMFAWIYSPGAGREIANQPVTELQI
jgi:hypothetical protein